MRRVQRTSSPKLLADNAERWTNEYRQAAEFRWPTVQGQDAGHVVRAALSAMTSDHCAYCDGFPMRSAGADTIDHFRPKSRFRELAFAWTNLFLACPGCQKSKRANWDEDLLRPDDDDYHFLRYFYFELLTGEVVPSPSAAGPDRDRARKTIELLGLNDLGRPTERLRALRQFRQLHVAAQRAELEDWEFRFVMEAVLDV